MKKEYLIFLIFPISQILMAAGNYSVMKNINIFSSAGFILSIIADIVLLFVLIRGAKKEKIEKELEKLKYLNEIETERNLLLEKNHQELFSMKADFEKRIGEIARNMEYGNRKDAMKDMDELQKELNNSRDNSYCQNAVVNAVMREKAKECKQKNISLEVSLMIPRNLDVDPLHICSIFSNLLDNAIEAVEAYEGTENVISVDAAIRGNYLFVKVKNPSTKEYVNRKHRKERGYGTQILADIAKKYAGQYEASFEKEHYSVMITVKVM